MTRLTFALVLTVTFAMPAFAQEAEVVTKLDAWADLDSTLHVRWITAPEHPSKGVVECRAGERLVATVDEDPSCLRGATNNRDSGVGWANNHRADIPDIKQWPVAVRIVGKTRDGIEFTSGSVTVEAPPEPQGKTKRGAIPLAVHPGDWALAMLPITVGVPFPNGVLGSPENVRVLLAGEEIPSQAVVVTRWREDLSVKWLRVDFAVSAGTEQVTLEYGTDVRRKDYGPDVVPFGMGAARPTYGILRDSDGKAYREQVEAQELEEAGPVKGVLRWSGHFVADDGSRLCAFTIRAHAWEATDAIRIDYTFENDNTETDFTSIRSLVLGVNAEDAPQSITVGAGDATVALREGERVFQREDFEWVTEPGGESGKRIEGVVSSGGGDVAVLRDFWQQWPASVELSERGVQFGLCPRLPEGFYASRKDEDKLYYQIRDGLHTFREGLSKTWELWLTGEERETAATLTGERPIASAPALWIEDSGALQKLAVRVRDEFPGYDEALAKGIESYLAVRDRSREYGMMNFGDWYGERTWNWGNLEYDLGHGFLTQFARSGKPEFFWRAEEAVRHERDIDTRHYAKDPRRVGQQWTHCIGHTAGYYPKEYKSMKVYASPGWSDNRGHVWAQGMFEHYLLGGDKRSFETATLIADNFGGPGMTNYRFFNAREPGWISKLEISAYLATEDLFYLNAAKIMLDAVHESSLATGDHGFHYHKLPNGHCNCPDEEKHYGEAGFMLGVEMTAQKMYYDVTGDERIARDIVGTAQFIADTMWVPEVLGFRYTSCPKTGASTGRAWIQMQGMAFAARYADDERLADICRRSIAAGWSSIPSSGKSAGYFLCGSAQALDELAHLPGPSFAEFRAGIERVLNSPARRLLPTNVPNPDFETETAGWPSRGWTVERCTEIKHSGEASLKISGAVVRQNEYVNTTYDASTSPYEIKWLKPGETYRLTAWLRVDQISEGAPGPSVRLATRDASGTRGSKSTNAYDLDRLGEWQKLTADIEIPEWNTRNYIALNTGHREEIEVEMYFDDISLVPADQAADDEYAYLRLEPETAELGGGATVAANPEIPGEKRLAGPGQAQWAITVPSDATYTLWAKLDAEARLGEVMIGGKQVTGHVQVEEPNWVRLGEVALVAGEVTVAIRGLGDGPRIGTLVMTTDPSSSL